MSKTFDIKLDVEKNLYSPMQILFYVSNNDVDSVELDFEIIQDENPFDLTGKTLQMAIKKPSGAVIYEGIEITSALEGKANTTLHQSAYVEAGLHTAEIYIQDAGETIVISPFYFNSWESITIQETAPPEGTTDVYWQNILSKPLTFPPSIHTHSIGDVTGLADALDSKANVGETGGGITTPIAIADVTGLQPALDSKMDDGDSYLKTETYNRTEIDSMALGGGTDVIVEDNLSSTSTINALSSNQGRILDETKAGIDHMHDIADVTGLQGALDGKVDDAEMTGKANTVHTHAIGDVTGLQPALDGKMDDGSAYLKTEAYAKTETYNKTEVYSKAETYNRTQIDAMAFPEGGGTAPVIVEDNLLSTSTTNALSSNQGRLLNETKSDIAHDHTIADITDFATGVAGAIPPEYLTNTEADALFLTPTEGDARYQASGTIPAHDHTSADILDFGTAVAGAIPPEYLTETEGDGRYQAIGTVPAHDHPEYLTETEADALFLTPSEADALFLTPTEGDARYQATGTIPAHTHDEYLTQPEGDALYQAIGTVPIHDHTSADITDFGTAVAGAIPPEYLTSTEADAMFLTPTEGDTRYQASGVVPTHTHVVANITDFPTEMTPKLMQSGIRGGARVGNGLGMSGEYLTVKSGNGLRTDGTTTYQVEIDRATTDAWYTKNATGQALTIWKGTQATYDGLTKDPNTLYFIIG